jgi:plasmid stability protein
MKSVTIRDVPEQVLKTVKVHAAQSGRSLQAYMLDLLARDAAGAATSPRPMDGSRGELAIRRARGSASNPETRGLSTEQLMELLRGA